MRPHARRLAGKTPEEVIAFYRAAGEAAMDARRRTKPRKGRTGSRMANVRVVHDREGQTLTVWFGDALEEFVCEETGRDVVLMKNRSGHVIGVEKLDFPVATLDFLLLETTDR